MSDLDSVYSVFKQVSQGDFQKWLDLRLPKLKMQTPREMIEKGQADVVISLLGSFLPKPKMP